MMVVDDLFALVGGAGL
ncbi:hypothetical protein [Paraburkholderia sp. BCC1884]